MKKNREKQNEAPFEVRLTRKGNKYIFSPLWYRIRMQREYMMAMLFYD